MSEFTRTVSEDDLVRLKADREAADAKYNALLTALDATVQRLPALPAPPPGPDEFQVTPLNERWNILDAPPAAGGWRGRLAGLVWRALQPTLARQHAFNSALVDHVNRNVAAQRAVPVAIASVIGLVRQHIEESIRFQSALVVYLQAVTPFVDTKDYEFAGLSRRVAEDAAVVAARADELTRGLAAGLSGLSDEILKRYESLVVRDQRYGGQLRELRTAVAAMQQSTLAVRRELERALVSGAAPVQSAAPAVATPAAAVPPTRPGGELQQLGAGDRLHAHQYAGFEDLFRGAELDIKGRMADYVPLFAGAADVLDVGCGRGEFLELLRDAGITARGLDLNHEMVERSRAKGFDVAEGDALSYLRSLPPGALGGLVATQVVEHLQPDYLLAFLTAATDALRPGAVLLLETINPACWSAFFDSYVRDLTHVRPVHPDTLQFLVTAAGFSGAEIQWRSPYPDNGKLQRVPEAVRTAAASDPAQRSLIDAHDRNVDRLNGLFFGFRDYAVVARRP
jgi:SAM-dependent methyltransferase